MKAEAGFTLVEALVALALGAVLAATVLSAVRLGAGAAARARAAAAVGEATARAGDVIAGDALHALALRAPEGPLFQGAPRSLAFAALPRPEAGGSGAPVLLRYDLQITGNGTTLLRSQAPLDDRNRPRPFSAPVAIWQTAGPAEFRYLDRRGRWLPAWDGADLPRAFALSLPGDAGVPRLAGRFLDLVEPACARGPGPDCSLPAGAFP